MNLEQALAAITYNTTRKFRPRGEGHPGLYTDLTDIQDWSKKAGLFPENLGGMTWASTVEYLAEIKVDGSDTLTGRTPLALVTHPYQPLLVNGISLFDGADPTYEKVLKEGNPLNILGKRPKSWTLACFSAEDLLKEDLDFTVNYISYMKTCYLNGVKDTREIRRYYLEGIPSDYAV